MAIQCSSCKTITANDAATLCFGCGNSFSSKDLIPVGLVIRVCLIGVILAIVAIAAQNRFHLL
jgi:hypothetical protein